MDLRTLYFQAAEAAAEAVHAVDDEVPEPNSNSVLMKLDVQVMADAPASCQGSGVAAMGLGDAEIGNGKAAEGGGGRDLTCPECGKAFLSDKAMYGHLRSHPEKGYKGATRPTTARAASAVAGDKKLRKAPRKEAELSAINSTAVEKKPWEEAELSTKWPVKAKRGRAPSTPSAGSSPVAATLSSSCSEEEKAAMILLEMASGRPTSEHEQPIQPIDAPDAFSGHQPMLLDHVAAGNQMAEVQQPIRPDHVAFAVTGYQMPEAEQVVRPELVPEIIEESPTPKAEEVTKLELATEAVHVVVPANKLIVPSTGYGAGTMKVEKRRLLDLEQMAASPAPADGADVKPPARRIPSPASDKKHECPTCHKSFPTYQALGGHMASHVKGSKHSARHDALAMSQAVHNVLAHHTQGGNVVTGGVGAGAGAGADQERQDVQPPHVCAQCHLTFPTGQALGGHKRKHWLPEKQRTQAARAAAAPRDFDLNELPKERGGENQP
ncbi:uncharacterized protein LOC133889509 [Phragmites australis]|uniref:uncharacterized protein LOC133889509 n=1 Tax=Phragmites australis TaxID=29695 RepID=UPI002D796960|nr:uncharacterized protein LOC133889509 [Phragmites australis]